MRYVAIDIETTGLSPESCNILQFAAVADDTKHPEVPVDSLPVLNFVINHLEYKGDAYALSLNADILRLLSEEHENNEEIELRGNPARVIQPYQLRHFFRDWLDMLEFPKRGVVCAGKNFAHFDLQFLNALAEDHGDFEFETGLHRRSLDPTILYLRSDDNEPPSLAECVKRAQLSLRPAHDAVDDAKTVIELLRVGLDYGY